MSADTQPPLILTLELDTSSSDIFDTLRRAHFPPALNHLSAHLTLFHHLPGERRACVEADLEEAATREPPELEVVGLRRLGRGVAYALASPALDHLRAGLARRWAEHLTPQDRQPFRAHVTVQNKASPAVAETLYAQLSRDFSPWRARGEALRLWRYLGGPWASVAKLPFSSAPGHSSTETS